MAETIVEPKAAAPAPAVEPTNPQASQEAPPQAQAGAGEAGKGVAIPDEVLQIPAFQGLFAGQPPAFSANGQEFQQRPEGKIIQAAFPALRKAGIGTYRSLQGDTAVLFNQFYVTGEEIKQADAAGQLESVAPPFDVVNQQIAQMGVDTHPSLQGVKTPEAFKQAAPTPPQSGSPVSAPPPSSEQEIKAQQARMKNMQPGAPTSGPVPGAGRLLSNILKPVI